MPEYRLSRTRMAVARTRRALGLTVYRRDARLVFSVATGGYLLAYLYAIGHLAPGAGGFELFVVADPLAGLFRPAFGPLSFTPVARFRLGPVTYLFSLNTVLGLGIAALVGSNLSLTYLAWRQPAACGITGPSGALAASVPAILSGTACCGPVVLLVFGIQASSVLLTAFQWLLPLAVALLAVSLVLVGRTVDPAAL